MEKGALEKAEENLRLIEDGLKGRRAKGRRAKARSETQGRVAETRCGEVHGRVAGGREVW